MKSSSKNKGLKPIMSRTEALLKILKKRGKLTPAAVVEEASRLKHPLHRFFCWDDTEAARRYREIQASDMIRHCKCVIKAEDETPQQVRVFHHVEDAVFPEDGESDTKTESHYAEITTVMETPEYMAQVIAECRRDLEAFVSKYKAFASLSGIVEIAKNQLMEVEFIEEKKVAAK